jgi:prepilin-type N-terminal cleavage/methylation domain-containing protein
MWKKTLQIHKGFTLMEVMVAVSIFAIVVTVGIGALLTINNSYRKAQTSRQAVDSLTYILESMSRSFRTGSSWAATGTGSSSNFLFTDQDGVDIEYEFLPPKIWMHVIGTGGTLAPDMYDLTPDNVTIEKLIFTTFAEPGHQKYVQINIAGKVANGRQLSDFSFQTGVSKRTGDQ